MLGLITMCCCDFYCVLLKVRNEPETCAEPQPTMYSPFLRTLLWGTEDDVAKELFVNLPTNPPFLQSLLQNKIWYVLIPIKHLLETHHEAVMLFCS